MRKTHLNPAFKRFQYLPHPPVDGPGSRVQPAPRATELIAQSPVPPELLDGSAAPHLGLQSPRNVQRSGPA